MDLGRLSSFLAAAEELHFGRAAQQLGILPSALGRNIRLLEEELGVRLFNRTTRNVLLTPSGALLLKEAPKLLHQANMMVQSVRNSAETAERVFRVGAIDSAAMGLIPELVHDFKVAMPEVELVIVEDKSANLIPKLLSGALDLAFVRPPASPKPGIAFEHLMDELTIVALPAQHPLVEKSEISIEDLAQVPLILPSPRLRPHSYNLTMQLFSEQGLQPNIVQRADEKQTIINLVDAKVGAAIIPFWYNRIKLDGIVYRPLVNHFGQTIRQLPLSMAWLDGIADETRITLTSVARSNIDRYAS